jgi:transposase, IS5 family
MRSAYNRQKSLFCQQAEHEYYTEWRRIEAILEAHPEFIGWVQTDLTEGLKHPGRGARGMTAEQVLRAAILKQANCWTYRELEVQLADSMMTRSFLKLDFDEHYSDSTLQANIKRIAPTTWEKISHSLVLYAKDVGLEGGRVIRIDATAIESNVHEPTDSSLLYDCIQSANAQFETLRSQHNVKVFSAVKAREAKSLLVAIINAKSSEIREGLYRKLIKQAKETQDRIEHVLQKLAKHGLQALAEYGRLMELSNMLPVIIEQTRRRVIKKEQVPVDEKIFSIFEPHTDLVVKGDRDRVYGHKTFFTVGASGIVIDTVLVQGNPNDAEYFMDMIARQKEIYDRYPRQVVTDGGFASEDNLFDAKDLGIKDVCFTKSLGLEVEEMVKSRWVFEKLRNFRAGIESVISCLKRGFTLNRVTWKGARGFGSYVHSAVVAYNLVRMAKLSGA